MTDVDLDLLDLLVKWHSMECVHSASLKDWESLRKKLLRISNYSRTSLNSHPWIKATFVQRPGIQVTKQPPPLYNGPSPLPRLILIIIRTAQHSDVEYIDSIVQGNFRMMLFNTKYTKISTIRKLPAYTVIGIQFLVIIMPRGVAAGGIR